MASNPEFLREGRALEDFFRPNRIVLGVESERALTVLQEIYTPIECPKVVTDLTTAELIKHASNSFLSTKISFMNMVADVCDAVGADVTKVAEGLGFRLLASLPDSFRPVLVLADIAFPKTSALSVGSRKTTTWSARC